MTFALLTATSGISDSASVRTIVARGRDDASTPGRSFASIGVGELVRAFADRFARCFDHMLDD